MPWCKTTLVTLKFLNAPKLMYDSVGCTVGCVSHGLFESRRLHIARFLSLIAGLRSSIRSPIHLTPFFGWEIIHVRLGKQTIRGWKNRRVQEEELWLMVGRKLCVVRGAFPIRIAWIFHRNHSKSIISWHWQLISYIFKKITTRVRWGPKTIRTKRPIPKYGAGIVSWPICHNHYAKGDVRSQKCCNYRWDGRFQFQMVRIGRRRVRARNRLEK